VTKGLFAINKPGAAYSKAARNERIKLRAIYLNNIAVGLYVGGVAVPALAFVARYVVITTERTANVGDFKALFALFCTAAAGIFLAEMFQTRASNILRDLED
jgi:hypothetical protein